MQKGQPWQIIVYNSFMEKIHGKISRWDKCNNITEIFDIIQDFFEAMNQWCDFCRKLLKFFIFQSESASLSNPADQYFRRSIQDSTAWQYKWIKGLVVLIFFQIKNTELFLGLLLQYRLRFADVEIVRCQY